MNISEILSLKYPDQIKNGQIVLQDDGEGPYIIKWQMGSIPKPTNAEILTWRDDATVISNKAVYNRLNAPDGYGSVGDQLDMIYKDLINGTQLWQQKIGNVKDVLYPKTGIPTTPPNVTPIVTEKRNSPSAAYKEILMAYNNTTQAISGINKVDVTFNTIVSDPNGVWINNKYKALTGGIYEIIVFTQIGNSALSGLASAYQWQLYMTQTGGVNQAIMVDSYTHAILASTGASLRGTLMLTLAKNDTLHIQVQKNKCDQFKFNRRLYRY